MDDIGISMGMAIFMELFCSIHMSAFVLFPLAEFINPEKKTSIFCKMFVIRMIILIIGNFINPIICIFDFLAIFFGAFILLPVLIGLRKEKETNNEKISKKKLQVKVKKTFDDYTAVTPEELEKIGIMDSNLFQKEMYTLFFKYQNYFSNLNLDMLAPICSNNFFQNTNYKLDELKRRKRFEVRESIQLNSMKIYNISSNNYLCTVSILFDVSFVEYLKDEDGNILAGDQYNLKRQIFDVLFQKDIRDKENHKKCPSCGAPVMPYDLSCDYCSTVINNKQDWRISSIAKKTLKEDNIFK